MSAIVTAEGVVVHADRPARLCDEVWPRIIVGGSWDPWPLHVDLEVLACPRREVDSTAGPTADTRMYVPLDDRAPSTAEVREAELIADHLAGLHRAGARLAFRCYLGLNRSMLLAGLLRLRLADDTGAEVIAAARAARGPDVLCNVAFAEHLAGAR